MSSLQRYLSIWLCHALLLTTQFLPIVIAAGGRSRGYSKDKKTEKKTSRIEDTLRVEAKIEEEPLCVCQVAEISFLQQDGTTGERQGRHALDCLPIPGISPPGFSQMRLATRGIDDFKAAHLEALHAGEWWIQFPCFWTSAGTRKQNIDDIQTLTPEKIKDLVMAYLPDESSPTTPAVRQRRLGSSSHFSGNGHTLHRRSSMLHPKEPIHDRRLSSIGVQKCGIVIVDANNVVNPLTIALAEEQVYQLSSDQLESCSHGSMQLTKHDETVRVTLPRNIGYYDDDNISEALFEAICLHYGLDDDCRIATERGLDHILFALPYGLKFDEPNSFWAFASTGDYRRFSVYSGGNYNNLNAGFFVPSTIIHEYVNARMHGQRNWCQALDNMHC